MATLVLGLAGQAIGNALLPAGFQLFGQTITGAAIGGAIGAYAGSQVDQLLTGSPRVEGPRLKELHVQGSTPGAAIPRVWGAARLAGQVIWAARFTETSERRGGKGGPRVTDYSYTASFAVGVCEGEIGGIGRVWADGKPLALDGVTMRVHRGGEEQLPDPLIETIEGDAPAYRGLAYVVFEDLPLEPFGNRVPQLSFEVMRPVDADGAMESLVEAVCLIPGSGEFALATTRVLHDAGRGAWTAENVNNRTGKTDIEASLDQLQAQLPNVKRVALVVSWFGDDLRCGACRIRPGVEIAEKRTHPAAWSVAGVTRDDAYVVSASDGRPNYGGTPSDASVRQAIAALKARGMEVTLYPFILMDVPPDNNLPDPYGGVAQAAFPWRGRITCHPAAGEVGSPDGTGDAAAQVDAFFDGDWGLRRMILHYAELAAEAGGVDTFLIGSELRGVTTVRSGVSDYPAVAHLVALAEDVRAIVGPETAVSYAADWTEWRGHDGGEGDWHFHLDPLWASDAVDFVGIDFYAPLADWRDGAGHRDEALSADGSPYDLGYLAGNVEGGEGFDWYYASDADRVAQARTPITDGAYGKPWTFRAKDLRGWWSNAHVNRVGGVETVATDWAPGLRPLRFTEIGCPAVDKGANQPNVFYDPRSSESALPWFSSGARDDRMQRAAIEALIGYWLDNNAASPLDGRAMVDVGRAHVWAWDARPFPDWPLRTGVWADGELWRTGHWLNGRAGAAPLGVMVCEIAAASGLHQVDVSALQGACAGYALDRTMSAREALSPLMTAYAFDAVESGGVVRFFHAGAGEVMALASDDLAVAEEGAGARPVFRRTEAAALPGAAKVSFIDAIADYAMAAGEARLNAPRSAKIASLSLPVALSRAEAEAAAFRTLHEAWAAREGVTFTLPPSLMRLEPGDAISLDGGEAFRMTRVAEGGRLLAEAGLLPRHLYRPVSAELEGDVVDPPAVFGPPVVAVLDLAPIAFGGNEEGLYLAAFAAPWPGAVSVLRGDGPGGAYREALRLTRRAVMGETASALARAAPHRWDRANTLDVVLYGGELSAADELAVLNGANRAALETAPGVWEVIQFAEATLVAPSTYRLGVLLRGQAGSEGAIVDLLASGARFVLLDAGVRRGLALEDAGGATELRVGPAGAAIDDAAMAELAPDYVARGRLPWRVCQMRARRDDDGAVAISWLRRARDDVGRLDELEVSLGEDAERYEIEILDGEAVVRRATCDAPVFAYSSAMQMDDWGGAASAPVTVRVAQISPRFGAGAWRDAALTF